MHSAVRYWCWCWCWCWLWGLAQRRSLTYLYSNWGFGISAVAYGLYVYVHDTCLVCTTRTIFLLFQRQSYLRKSTGNLLIPSHLLIIIIFFFFKPCVCVRPSYLVWKPDWLMSRKETHRQTDGQTRGYRPSPPSPLLLPPLHLRSQFPSQAHACVIHGTVERLAGVRWYCSTCG